MSHDDPPDSGKFLPGLGSLYSLDKAQGIKKHLSGLTISNGMAWSSDDKSMFFIDTPARKVYVFDYDPATGTISEFVALGISLVLINEDKYFVSFISFVYMYIYIFSF